MTTDSGKWEALRAPFAPEEIELLPKPTQKDARRGNCPECGGYHGLPAVHLSYVGHAGVTMRLNEVDPTWTWEPFALDDRGLPLMMNGALWIRLTVLGVTRIGVGDAAGKTGPNAIKEAVGDAIRNAAMRFGVATYLWSKSEAAQAILTRQGHDESVANPDPFADAQAEVTKAWEEARGPFDLAAAAAEYESLHDRDLRAASAEDLLMFAAELRAETQHAERSRGQLPDDEWTTDPEAQA